MSPANPGDFLLTLLGTWRGRGVGDYPTIERFEYDELLRFEHREPETLIHFEQRTTLVDGDPSHWESGFLRWLDNGTIELSCAQDSGRVEVLGGAITGDANEWTLNLEARVLAHDDRLVHTTREWRVSGDELSYAMRMSTTTTDEPKLQRHLRAFLAREA